MGITRWEDLQHKNSPERREEIKQKALADYDRLGYAALRKAREMTQAELAAELGLTQGAVAQLEQRSDLQLSTLARYIRAMGGELEIRAVFPEATFNLEPPAPSVPASTAKPRAQKRSPASARPAAARREPQVAAAR